MCAAAAVVDIFACGADKIQLPGLGPQDAITAEEVYGGEVAKRGGGSEAASAR